MSMSEFFWSDVDHDASRERHEVQVERARVAASDAWPFLSQAANRDDYLNRLALVEDRIHSAVASATSTDAEFVSVLGALHTTLDNDWHTLREARVREARAKRAQRRQAQRRVAYREPHPRRLGEGTCNGEFEYHVAPMTGQPSMRCRECGFVIIDLDGYEHYAAGSRRYAERMPNGSIWISQETRQGRSATGRYRVTQLGVDGFGQYTIYEGYDEQAARQAAEQRLAEVRAIPGGEDAKLYDHVTATRKRAGYYDIDNPEPSVPPNEECAVCKSRPAVDWMRPYGNRNYSWLPICQECLDSGAIYAASRRKHAQGDELDTDEPTGQGAADVADVPTPGGESGYPQPEGVSDPDTASDGDGDWANEGDAAEKADTESEDDTEREARLKTAVSLSNVGVDPETGNGVGTTPSGERVQFRLSASDRESLKAVLYSDLAVNFSGVDVTEDEIIRESSRRAGGARGRRSAGLSPRRAEVRKQASMDVSVWADGSGNWHAKVTEGGNVVGDSAAAEKAARDAIVQALSEREGPNFAPEVVGVRLERRQSRDGNLESFFVETNAHESSRKTATGLPGSEGWYVVWSADDHAGPWGTRAEAEGVASEEGWTGHEVLRGKMDDFTGDFVKMARKTADHAEQVAALSPTGKALYDILMEVRERYEPNGRIWYGSVSDSNIGGVARETVRQLARKSLRSGGDEQMDEFTRRLKEAVEAHAQEGFYTATRKTAWSIEDARRVLDRHQYETVDGIILDAQTANVLVTVHDALNETNQQRLTDQPLPVAVDMAWKLVAKAAKKAGRKIPAEVRQVQKRLASRRADQTYSMIGPMGAFSRKVEVEQIGPRQFLWAVSDDERLYGSGIAPTRSLARRQASQHLADNSRSNNPYTPVGTGNPFGQEDNPYDLTGEDVTDQGPMAEDSSGPVSIDAPPQTTRPRGGGQQGEGADPNGPEGPEPVGQAEGRRRR